MLKDGLYEQIVNRMIEHELAHTDKFKKVQQIDNAEASKVLSRYAAEIVEKGLQNVQDNGGSLIDQVAMLNRVISTVQSETHDDDYENLIVTDKAEQLLALYEKQNTILAVDEKAAVERPETSLAQSSLFTGAVHEPQMYSELRKEIRSCNRIDMLVSFIKWSGLRIIMEELINFTQSGGQLRVITTSYMGATDIKAVEELRKLANTSIKVSYDTKSTRLHAKAYMFYRDTGFTTAYVGSSNMSRAAMSSGLEWNLKITKKDMPETIDKITATFESYWNSVDFEYYDEKQTERLKRALKAEKYTESSEIYTMDIRPYSYQQEILDKLKAEREVRSYFRNLVVAATGTGKTVISALDYKRFCKEHSGKPCRLLFVAHREEILKQSLYTFRAVMKETNFGDLFVGSNKPDRIDHLFMSIQTFNSRDFTKATTADYYDYIVVDEFHHAAAPTYRKLLTYYKPQILLGLTATPERMDGKNILDYFDNRIAAEIRLPEAIDRKLLCPFQYFGVTDTVDLNELKWTRGGYDKSELSNVYALNSQIAERRANHIVESVLKYVTDIDDVKGLGFCVSVEHANFMAEYFVNAGIPAICLTGDSDETTRNNAKTMLISGKIRFIFVVDLYNEGVDIPEVNTVLFLRPTESLTIFLQQFGRGLRLSDGKECLTVLDFIGQANKRYNFEDKFSALLTRTRHSLEHEIKNGFVSLPKGCYIQLEKKAARYVLDNIRASIGNTAALAGKLFTFEEDTGLIPTLGNYLDYYHLDARSLYHFSTFSELKARVGMIDSINEPAKDAVCKALPKLCIIDSRRWIKFLLNLLPSLSFVDFEKLAAIDIRMLQMFYITIWGKAADDWNSDEVLSNLYDLADSPVMLGEIIELLNYRYDRIDFVDEHADLGFDCPLDVHCSYTRDQLFVALDFMRPITVREGVKWLEQKKIDVLNVTLNKSEKDYSPTTMYQDYSVNSYLFHWQSQSTTSEQSATGQRYIHHKEKGSRVLLFVRENKKDLLSDETEAYTYLGTANYLNHEGSKPMNVLWALDYEIPAKFLSKTNKLVAI